MAHSKLTGKRIVLMLVTLVGVFLVGYVLPTAGLMLGALLRQYVLEAIVEMFIPSIAASAEWLTGRFYLNFLGVWVLMLPLIAIIPFNRPMLKSLTPKTKGNTPKMFAVGLLIGLGTNLLCALIAMLNGDIRIAFSAFQPITLLLLFLAVLIQSAGEELIFRVFVHQRLLYRFGSPVFAAVISAILFSVCHGANPGVGPLPVLNLFITGLMYSAMIIWLDSPWAAMACHAAWNFCQNILLGLPNSGQVMPYTMFKLEAVAEADSFAYNVLFGLEGGMPCTVLTLAGAGLIAWWGIKRKKAATNIWHAEV